MYKNEGDGHTATTRRSMLKRAGQQPPCSPCRFVAHLQHASVTVAQQTPAAPGHTCTPAHPRPTPCSNAKIRSLVAEVEGGLEAMAALGWQQVQEEGEEVLTLAKGAATMAQVRRWGLVQAHAAPCKVWLCSRGKQGAWAGSRALPCWDPRSYRQPAICPAFSGMCCAGTTAVALSALRMVVFSPPPLAAGALHPGGAAGVQEERPPAEARQVQRQLAGQR